MEKDLTVYQKISLIEKLAFEPCGLHLTKLKKESESHNYHAHQFQLAGYHVQFRIAKITPTKTGQFVTLWKRNATGITIPFDLADDYHFYMVAVTKDFNFGVFVFPKKLLYEHRILSGNKSKGKRGFRVYPTWYLPTSKQAVNTQQWQSPYFLDLSDHSIPALPRLNFLFGI